MIDFVVCCTVSYCCLCPARQSSYVIACLACRLPFSFVLACYLEHISSSAGGIQYLRALSPTGTICPLAPSRSLPRALPARRLAPGRRGPGCRVPNAPCKWTRRFAPSRSRVRRRSSGTSRARCSTCGQPGPCRTQGGSSGATARGGLPGATARGATAEAPLHEIALWRHCLARAHPRAHSTHQAPPPGPALGECAWLRAPHVHPGTRAPHVHPGAAASRSRGARERAGDTRTRGRY